MMDLMPIGTSFARRWWLRVVLTGWAAIALFALLTSANRVERPFPGFIVAANLYLGATDLADWTGPRAGLAPLDRVVAVDGEPVADANDLIARVERAPVGTPFRYTLADGRTLTVPSMAYGAWDFARSNLTFWLAAVGHLALGGWVVRQRPNLAAAIGHWRYCQIFAMFLLAAVFGERWWLGNALNLIGSALMAPALVELVLGFPERPYSPRTTRWWRRAGWGVGAAISGLVLASLAYEPLFPWAFYAVVAAPVAAMAGAVGVWCWQAFGAGLERPLKGQARMALAGLGLSLGPSIGLSVAAIAKQPVPGFEFAFVAFCAFPAAIALAIVRHHAFDLGYLLRRATVYAILGVALAGAYGAIAFAGHRALGHLAPSTGGAGAVGFLAAVAVAVAVRPWHAALERAVARWFPGGAVDPLSTLRAIAVDSAPLGAEALGVHLVGAVRRVLDARWVQLRWNGEVVSDGSREPGALPAAVLAVTPLHGPSGGLEVGPRGDDAPYGPQERALLEVLAGQTAMALDRVWLVEAKLAAGLREATAIGHAEAREQLLKQIVHDLGTELSNIAVSADLARQLPGEPGPLESIQASLTRIEKFLADKRYRLQRAAQARTEVGAGLESAIATLTPQLALKGQRLESTVAAADAVVPVSDVELAQVIVNVVGNASKFSPEGGRIRLEATRLAQHVVIVVEDEGPGVSAMLLGSLGDGRRSHPGLPGSGLGLQNCRALVAAAGGTLEWYNGVRGAVVEVRLPVLG
jgi:signal transduction histidine kinase